MNRIDLIRMGLKNLFRRKLRTFLTTLGIIIGTISIVLMVSLGLGMQKNMEKQLSERGSLDIVEVYPAGGNNGNYPGGGMVILNTNPSKSKTSNNKKEKIQNSDIITFKQIEGVEAVSPIIEHTVVMKSKKVMNSYIQIKGMTLEFMEKYGLDVSQGRMLTAEDKNGFIIGYETLYEFYNPNKENNWWESIDPETGDRLPPSFNPLENKITMSFDRNYGRDNRYIRYGDEEEQKPVRPINVKAIGVLSQYENWRKNNSAYMEINQLTALKDKYDKITGYREYDGKRPKKDGYEKVFVYVPKRKKLETVQQEIQKLGFTARSDANELKHQESMSNTIKLVFGAIGGISLLVAAIGITNTMVMAIYERRKEIGVMKVIGSSIKDIKKLFLFESATIGLLGGILGILISIGISILLNNMQNSILLNFLHIYNNETNPDIFIMPPWLIISAMVFTSLIGLISGYLPARKAMKLSALEAIKTE
ncbi:ABC transporter permease [Vallitalea sp.]|jgi:ABC-type antimicrobial peptide transport system permease subunit|uniref:ABC transporter permease n=1 Tax=Vallitalea sp. TaxID=1882829 RepID=UPI0025E6C095|nr:ABC transporter permease [Vallitalea sp.]MCT4687831.1 ABC transporter permease [Vallitalea sp.]